ncbi:MAG: hypothetical protein WC313_00705 [Candidatus Kapaibacterium sp.]
MKNSTIFLVLIASVFCISLMSSCDEIDKLVGNDKDYDIDKKIQVGQDDQVITAGDDFQIIIPGGATNSDIQVFVKKEDTAPNFLVQDYKSGSNVYKVKINGVSAIEAPLKFVMSYDKGKIPVGRMTSSTLKVFARTNNIWKAADYIINDEASKVTVSLSGSLTPKIIKDNDILMSDAAEVILCDAYNLTLEPLDNSDKCDCGWQVDYSVLTKNSG